MKHNFKFDKKTGTMVPTDAAIAQGLENKAQEQVVQSKPTSQMQKPEFAEEKKVEVKSETINIQQNQIVQMKRVNKPTPIQLINEDGLPEAYLDSVTTGVMMFRDRQDYDIYQIVDERTSKPLAYIGGYALQINFNMAELKSTERIEQCLQGLTKLFRKVIMDQALNR